MEWLELNEIKDQLRIEYDYHDEDKYLTSLGEVAEETVLGYVDYTYDELVEKYGKFPKRARQASLELVDLWYQRRSPGDSQNISIVPYGNIDFLLRPLMRLAIRPQNDNS